MLNIECMYTQAKATLNVGLVDENTILKKGKCNAPFIIKICRRKMRELPFNTGYVFFLNMNAVFKIKVVYTINWSNHI